jgi:hypothetical protein
MFGFVAALAARRSAAEHAHEGIGSELK